MGLWVFRTALTIILLSVDLAILRRVVCRGALVSLVREQPESFHPSPLGFSRVGLTFKLERVEFGKHHLDPQHLSVQRVSYYADRSLTLPGIRLGISHPGDQTDSEVFVHCRTSTIISSIVVYPLSQHLSTT